MKKILLFVILLFTAIATFADDDTMITRDGEQRSVKIDRISQKEVVFTDMKKKKRGKQSLPTAFVYLIKTEKRGNIFFDEQGNQTTRLAAKVGKKDDVVYLAAGEEVVAYQLNVQHDVITYKTADKKKAPVITKKKSEVFMIRYADGSKDLYSGVKAAPGNLSTAPIGGQQPVSAQPIVASRQQTMPTASPAPALVSQQAAPVLASANGTKAFNPAPDMEPQEIINRVYAACPYVLHRKGAVAEYCCKHGEKDAYFIGVGTYLQLRVADETVQNGLVKVLTNYAFLNKQHEPSKGISAKFKETYFSTEIDTAGNFHLTNDILHDLVMVSRRQGYAALIPGAIGDGAGIRTHTIVTSAKNSFGGTVKQSADYTAMRYVGLEQVSTPAGTFDCIKLEGDIVVKDAATTDRFHQTWWLARNVGFVRIDVQRGKDPVPVVTYLNALTDI